MLPSDDSHNKTRAALSVSTPLSLCQISDDCNVGFRVLCAGGAKIRRHRSLQCVARQATTDAEWWHHLIQVGIPTWEIQTIGPGLSSHSMVSGLLSGIAALAQGIDRGNHLHFDDREYGVDGVRFQHHFRALHTIATDADQLLLRNLQQTHTPQLETDVALLQKWWISPGPVFKGMMFCILYLRSNTQIML